jgi:hypothetical protein
LENGALKLEIIRQIRNKTNKLDNMKKILTTLAISGFTLASFAQGTVSWTGVVNLFIAQTNATSTSGLTAGGGNATGSGTQGATAGNGSTLYFYELLVSSSATTAPTTAAGLSSSWLDTGLEAENGASANGRILQLNSGTAVVANNWGINTTMNVIMVGWSANLGNTYSAALANLSNWSTAASSISGNAFFGIGSSVGSLAAQPGNPGVVVFGTSAGQVNDGASNPLVMNLLANPTVVPEPGTMALAGLGGLSLLAFRRKK